MWHKKIDRDTRQSIGNIKLIAFDFDGVFTDNSVYVDENGIESVRCWRGDGLGLQKLRELGVDAVIISTESNKVVDARARKLGLVCIQGVDNKKKALESLARSKDIPLSHIAFVGNDVNDLPCLEVVGLPIVVHDAHPAVLNAAKYQTRAKGGCGAVREICDLFERVIDENSRSK
jgi:YrbI family 3-deoxy-D-manno-octulosonate 8-phosphate phosphatase